MMLWESPRLNDHVFRAAIQRWQIGTTKHRTHPKFYFRSFCFMATKISESLDRFQQKTIGTEGQHLSPHHFSWFGPVKVGNFNWKMMKHAPVVISIQVLTIQLPGKVIVWGPKFSEISWSKVPNKYNSFPYIPRSPVYGLWHFSPLRVVASYPQIHGEATAVSTMTSDPRYETQPPTYPSSNLASVETG